MREVAKFRAVEIDWRLFSLELIHEDKEDRLADLHAKGTPALRSLALLRIEHGSDAVGRAYEALGTRVHDRGEELGPDAVRAALADAGFDPNTVDRALTDDDTAALVRAEHEEVVSDVGAFGVPTIVLSSGRGMFGPVLARAPEAEEAAELWDHVRALIDVETFFELKRERDREPGE